MNKIDFKQKGITLIALVITIIILLILAGVTIGIATSGTGFFDKAKEVTQKYQNAQEDEEKQLAQYSNDIDNYVLGNRENLTEVELMSNYDGVTSGSIELSESYQNFKQLCFITGGSSMTTGVWVDTSILLVSQINMVKEKSAHNVIRFGADILVFDAIDNTHFSIISSTHNYDRIFKIIGIK